MEAIFLRSIGNFLQILSADAVAERKGRKCEKRQAQASNQTAPTYWHLFLSHGYRLTAATGAPGKGTASELLTQNAATKATRHSIC